MQMDPKWGDAAWQSLQLVSFGCNYQEADGHI